MNSSFRSTSSNRLVSMGIPVLYARPPASPPLPAESMTTIRFAHVSPTGAATGFEIVTPTASATALAAIAVAAALVLVLALAAS